MSAWLCGNKTLSLCVDVLKSKEFQEEFSIGEFSEYSNIELLNELSDLNTKSLNCRYGLNDEHILSNQEYVHLYVSDVQRHKSVCCYLYQTCECEENEFHPLFRTLRAWSDIHRGEFEDKWDNAKWDMDSPL